MAYLCPPSKVRCTADRPLIINHGKFRKKGQVLSNWLTKIGSTLFDKKNSHISHTNQLSKTFSNEAVDPFDLVDLYDLQLTN